jgi:hypothetical protein
MPKPTRDIRRTASFTADEDRELEAAASRAGLTATAFMRMAALKLAREGDK